MKKRTDWHGIIQRLFDETLPILCGRHVIKAEREDRSYFQVDYFCVLDMEREYDDGITEGIRPLDHMLRFNCIEIKGPGDTLTELLFRRYVARSFYRIEMASDNIYHDEGTLTILTSHKPLKLFKAAAYNFHELTPWKFRVDWIAGLEIFIVILPELRDLEGGEPMAYLQALEGNERYQRPVWERLLLMDLSGKMTLRGAIIEIDQEGFMSIAEELKLVGEKRGERKTLLGLIARFSKVLPNEFSTKLVTMVKTADSDEDFETIQDMLFKAVCPSQA